MEDVCRNLGLDDLFPNPIRKVTLRELIDKDEIGEGYVEKILDHDKTAGTYLVKWIGFKNPTWTRGDGIPANDLEPYKERVNI